MSISILQLLRLIYPQQKENTLHKRKKNSTQLDTTIYVRLPSFQTLKGGPERTTWELITHGVSAYISIFN